jgi:hypothetical protein
VISWHQNLLSITNLYRYSEDERWYPLRDGDEIRLGGAAQVEESS